MPGQRGDPLPVKRWLEAEVKALKGLGGHELGGAQRHVDPAGFPRGIFLAQQSVDCLDSGDFAFLQLLQPVIESFKRAASSVRQGHRGSGPEDRS
ncbi:hypothetical protein HKX21_17650 [Sulfitobacter sp. KS8]|nr:hypothetical protein [Sulfitobacter sp. KS8]